MDVNAAATDSSAAVPDWSTIQQDILCPLCDYNLRGLSEPRCPECGHRFEWRDLFERTPRHPYLFEHHPERNVWSFVRTVWDGQLPRRFWRRLLPTHKPNTQRLVVYWALSMLPMVLMIATLISFSGYTLARTIRNLVGYTTLAILAWPWMTFAALSLFRISLRRKQIHPIHVTRCLVYAADVMFWFGLIGIGLLIYQTVMYPRWSAFALWLRWGYFFMLEALVLVVMMSYRLAVAYRRYLRFDHPEGTVILAQIIVVLVFCKLFLMMNGL